MRVKRLSALLLFLLTPVVIMATVWVMQPGQGQVALDLQQARLAQARNQPAEAAAALERVLKKQPWRVDLYEQIGSLELQAGNVEAALAAYEKGNQQTGLGGSGFLNLSDLYIENEQYDQAKRTLLFAANSGQLSTADFEKAYQMIGEVGDAEDRQTVLNAWLIADPRNARVQYLNGVALAVGQPAQAVLLLEQAAAAEEYQNAATILLDALDAASQEESPSLRAFQIGRAMVSLQEWHAAEAAFEQAVALKPELAEGWALLAEVRQALGKPAAVELERALALDPDSTTVQALAALYWRRQGRPEVGLVYLHAAAAREPEVAYWQIELGRALCDLNNMQDALPHFVRATEVEPKSAQSWIELARFSLNYDIEPATVGLPAARQAVMLAPKDAAALDVMGALLFTQGDLASAERFLQQSLQLDAANADANLHMGQVFLAGGDLTSARPYLDQAARSSPETAVGKLAERLIQQHFPKP
ncbi:MAG: tetratricopeptide repeat protein [Chloroflexi bacterium]|nr:tetratricopeptide repeat protein [Chloroflexota bacterium]